MIDLGVLYDILKTALKPGCTATAFFCQAYARTFFVWEKNPVALQPGVSKVRVAIHSTKSTGGGSGVDGP
jgi:hypothetical protein